MAQPSPNAPEYPRPEWLVQFGQRLRLARGRAGLTQEGLGAPDLSKSFISLLESGRSYPSVETVTALARRLNTSVASLLLDPAELRRETALNVLRLAADMDLHTRGGEAVQLTAAAEALLPDMPAELIVRAALVRAHASIAADRLDEAAVWADEAAAAAGRHRLGSAVGMALALKGLVEVRRGMFARAVPILEKAVEIMRRTKTARTEENVRALLSLGAARFYLGHTDRAQRATARALELATRLRLHGMRGRALTGLAQVERARGHLDNAADLLGQAHDALALVEDLKEMARVLSNLGVVRREQRRSTDALAAFEQALRIRERLGDMRGHSATLEEMAAALLDMGRHTDAARAARRAIKEAHGAADNAREAWAQVTLGRILRAQGRRAEAIDILRGAVSTLTRLGLDSQAASAAGELGVLLSNTGTDGEATQYLTQAFAGHQPGYGRSSLESAIEGLTD